MYGRAATQDGIGRKEILRRALVEDAIVSATEESTHSGVYMLASGVHNSTTEKPNQKDE